MKLTQEEFEQIVNALVDQLNAKHAHVQPITPGDSGQPFHLGYAVAADALHAALQAHGAAVVSVVDVDHLWNLREAFAKSVQEIADQMAAIPKNGIVVSQERWDQLFGAWDQANKRLQEVGQALVKAHGL